MLLHCDDAPGDSRPDLRPLAPSPERSRPHRCACRDTGGAVCWSPLRSYLPITDGAAGHQALLSQVCPWRNAGIVPRTSRGLRERATPASQVRLGDCVCQPPDDKTAKRYVYGLYPETIILPYGIIYERALVIWVNLI
jgi:hypothetical protein